MKCAIIGSGKIGTALASRFAGKNVEAVIANSRGQFACVFALLVLSVLPAFAADAAKSQLVAREIESKSFVNNQIGVSPVRKLVVYLPPGYDKETRRYPVVYFLPSPRDTSFRAIFDEKDAQDVLNRAVATGTIGKFIFVVVDMTTPLGCSWYVNSPVTGNWEDFMVQELVSYIDANFRTLPTRDSRGIVGHSSGGYGAIRFGMKYPQVFGAVYAMHPLGLGSGATTILAGLPNWELMEKAKTLEDVKADVPSTIFTSIFQAHVPDASHPPLYVEFPAHRVEGKLVIDANVMDRMRNSFFLESLIGQYADNLKTLRGFKFDWARSDQEHVYNSLAFTHKLNEYGIVHEAEEYSGTWSDDPYWGVDGRVTTDVLPFFQQHLVFSN